MRRIGILAIVIGASVLAFVILKPFIFAPKEHGWRPPCMGRLSLLGKCCQMYRIDHGGQNPSCLQDLTPYGNLSKYYVCPDSHKTPGAITNVDAWSDYILVPLPSNAPSETIQMFCSPSRHRGEGANALYRDGSVSWLLPDDVTKALRTIIYTRSTNMPPRRHQGQPLNIK
jgi:hypothetical protein